MRWALRLLVSAASLGLGALVVALPGGCGSATPTALTTVHGVVHFQGDPLAGGMIVFAPDPERGTKGASARATIAKDGTFQLQLEGSPNIAPGWYRIAIAEPPTFPDSPTYTTTSRDFPTRLRRPDHSQIVRQVLAGKENVFEFLIDAGHSNVQ